MSRIELKNISHYYGSEKVLTDVNLCIKDGEFFTLLGPSGCGKTTLLRLIAGFLPLGCGDILLDNKSIGNIPPEKRNIGFVFQNYALFPSMTVWENVCFGLRIKKESHIRIKEIGEKYLKLVDMLDFKDRKIQELSGGQQQRVAVARSLAIEPDILLLDEPMSNLDVSLREEMRNEIKRIQRELGITTIFVTHDQNEALSMSDRIAVFKEGHCLSCDTPENLYFYCKDEFTAGFLGKTNIFTKDFLIRNNINCEDDRLFVRPERISILKMKEDSSFEAVIIKKQFLGNVTRYFCQSLDVITVVDSLSFPSSFKEGEKVFLKLN